LQAISGRHLPISRVVESLDRKGLQNLIEAICQSHPYLVSELTGLAPKVTVTTSVENLKNHLHAVYSALPYKGDQRGDYAYLRVRPHVEEFLSALSDYTVNFLPPQESQPSNSLEFLDIATELLNQLPEWSNPLNNHHRNMAYQDLSTAWTVAIKEVIKRSNGLGLAHGNWEDKLCKHNANCGDRLKDAVKCIQDELSWLR
jgi:protein Cut8